MSLLAIDVGTTGCKAGVFSTDGKMHAAAYREYQRPQLPSGWIELDSKKVLQNIFDCIAQAASQVDGDPVMALSVSSMGEAMTPVNGNREIIGNCILCSDTRGVESIKRFSEKINQQEFYSINPNILGPNYSLPMLLWIKEHQPELYRRTFKFLLWGDLVTYLLGGLPVTSYSLANRTLLFDIHQEKWSDKLLNLSGITSDKLPDPVPTGTLAGTVSDAIAGKLNLPPGVKIVVGGHDQCCNALGAGAIEKDKTVCGLGTFECYTSIYEQIPRDKRILIANGLNIEHHVIPGRYVSFIYNQSGSLIKWFRDTFAAADKKLYPNEDIYNLLISEIPTHSTDVLVLPHFEITGPPKFITDSCGIIVGLRATTTRGEILKAIMEGITFYFIEGLEAVKKLGVKPKEFIATGGGAKSDKWLQLKANILEVPFKRLRQTECSLIGAAIIAGLADNAWNSPSEACNAFIETDTIFIPDEKEAVFYRQKFKSYIGLYPSFIRQIIAPT